MEEQVGLTTQIIAEAEKKKWKWIDIKESVETAYNDEIQRKLQSTIWVKGGCKSWYQDKDGKNRIIYSPTLILYSTKWLNTLILRSIILKNKNRKTSIINLI